MKLQIALFNLLYVEEDRLSKKIQCAEPFCRNINFTEKKWRPAPASSWSWSCEAGAGADFQKKFNVLSHSVEIPILLKINGARFQLRAVSGVNFSG